MKLTLTPVFLCGALLGLAMLPGCQSTGADKVDQTSTRIEEFGAKVTELQGQVSATAAALAQVVETASLDPKAAYKDFSKRVGQLASSSSSARSGLEKAKSEGAKLFDAWTKRLDTISDADIRKASEERRNDLQKALSKVVEEAEPTLTELEAFVTTAKDVDSYLAQDLTPKGIDGISGKAKSLSKSAKSIVDGLDDVVAAAKKAAPQFATAKPPPPPAG